ncbi:MAG: GTP pyrophosphokinase family protein [Defluviitaleaceae bacterium]|nr:GTP pyrophosphokinase family protein [Defluviitaleaceae bacterium]MCL2263907.1 GTP pyrophosphokinase family protein [Defluviitaleaceae bacterium]
MAALFPAEEFARLKKELVLFRCALSNMEMRVWTLLEEFQNLQTYNPIEHVKSRLKSPESIADKLKRRGFDLTAENARNQLSDIAGIRCICSYERDILKLAEVITRQPDIKILKQRDYIENPKASGYRSYHLIIEVPIYLTEQTERLPVEVQIRTQAMDFWASLEYKVRYKFNDEMPEAITRNLWECAEKISELDKQMFQIQDVANLTRQKK